MADAYKNHQGGLSSPAGNAATVSPHDTTPLADTSRAIYIGTAGNLAMTFIGGQSVTLTNVAAGQIYPFRVTHVLSTGTTAGGIVALW